MGISKALKKVRRFHENKKKIPKIVLRKVNRDEIIYGARAHNRQLPKKLRVKTEDYDIYTENPKREARELERALDKKFKGDFFKVEPAQFAGTHRVKSKINGKVYADYSKAPGKVPFKKIGGKRYVKLSHVKKTIRKTLKDPTAEFRHAKDRDALNRIKLAEKLKKARKRKPSQPRNGLVFKPSRFRFKPL